MDSQMIGTIIKFFPTIIVGLFIFFGILGGLLRGFRKSLIFLIHYVIALGINIALFLVIKNMLWSSEETIFTNLFPLVGDIIGADTSACKTIYDVLPIVAEKYAGAYSNYTGALEVAELQQVIGAIAGMVVNFSLATVFLITLPWVLRIFLWLIYLIFYSEGKYKRRKNDRAEEENDDSLGYKPRRFLGMLVGIVKGAIVGTLGVSLISSLFYIINGGIYYADDVEAKKLSETIKLDDLLGDVDLSSYGIDIDVIYDSLKRTRSGVGMIYDKILVEGEPVDFFLFDAFFSSNYETTDANKERIVKRFILRKEIAVLTNLFTTIVESDVVKTTSKDGITFTGFEINTGKLNDEFGEKIKETLSSSVFLTDILPDAIKGFAKALIEGKIELENETIKNLFNGQSEDLFDDIDLVTDLSTLFKIAVKALEIVPADKDGNPDFSFISDTNQMITLITSEENSPKVKEIISSIGEVKLITKIGLPMGIAYLTETMEDQIPEAIRSDLDFGNVDWENEFANIANIYEKVCELDLDFDCLINGTKHVESNIKSTVKPLAEETEEEELDPRLDYLLTLAEDEEFKTKFQDILDLLVGYQDSEGVQHGSYLLGKVADIGVKYALTLVSMPGEEEDSTKTVADVLGDSLEYYTQEELRNDLHTIVDSGLSVVPMVMSLLGGDTSNLIGLFVDIDVLPLKEALVGSDYKKAVVTSETFKTDGSLFVVEDNEYKPVLSGEYDSTKTYYEAGTNNGGIYGLTLFKKVEKTTVDNKEVITRTNESLLDEVIPGLLKGVAQDYIKEDDINAVTDWRNELIVLTDSIYAIQQIDGIENLDLSNPLGTMPTITVNNVNKLSSSISKSVLLKSVINSTFVQVLDDALPQERDGETISWSTVIDEENIVFEDTFDADGNVVKYGELNALLKAVSSLLEKDGEGNPILDLSNTENLSLSSLSKLTMTSVDRMTNSKILVYALDSLVGSFLGDAGDLNITLPENIEWANQYNEISVTELTYVSGKYYIYNETNESYDLTTSFDSTKTYYELTQTGEVWALVSITQISAFQDSTGAINIEYLTDFNKWKNLDTTSEHDDVDKLLDSQIISYNLDSLIDTTIGSSLDFGSGKLYPEYVNDKKDPTKFYLSDAVDDWNEELHAIIAVMTNEELGLIGADGSFSSSIGIMNVANLITATDDSGAVNLAKSRLVSRIFSDAIGDIVGGGSGSLDITVPDSIQGENWLKWSFDGVDGDGNPNYRNGEIYKLVKVVSEAKSAYEANNSTDFTADNLVEGIILMDDYSPITDSELIYSTISTMIIDMSEEADPMILVRDEAYVDASASVKMLKKVEVKMALDSLKAIGIKSLDNIADSIQIDNVLDRFKEKSTRRIVCNSNVINITFVNTLVDKVGSSLSIPTDLQDAKQENSAWYPAYCYQYVSSDDPSYAVKVNSWEACELNLTLLSLCELTTDSYKEASVKNSSEFLVKKDNLYSFDSTERKFKKLPSDASYSGATTYYEESASAISFTDGNMNEINTNSILKSLASVANVSDIDLDKSKIDVAYESSLLKTTISTKITDLSEGADKVICIRDEAFESGTSYIKSSEVSILIKFLDASGVDVSSLDASKILGNMKDSEIRRMISVSNILNITVVDKLTKADGVTVPSKFRDTSNNVDILDTDWYPTTDALWANSEIAKVLASLAELMEDSAPGANDASVKVASDHIDFSTSADVILNLLGVQSVTSSNPTDLRINVVYASDILAASITKSVNDLKDGGTVLVRDEAYLTSEYLNEIEIVQLVNFIKADPANGINENVSLNGINAEKLLALLNVDSKRQVIASSNILNITIVDKIKSSLTIPVVYKVDMDDSKAVDVRSSRWYAASNSVADIQASEIYKILTALSVFGITANGNEVELDDSKITSLVTLLKGTTLDTVYNSEVFSYTISANIISNPVGVPEFYKTNSSTSVSILSQKYSSYKSYAAGEYDFVAKEEVNAMVSALDVLGITNFNNADGISASDVTAKTNAEIATILSSATIANKVSSILEGNSSLSKPASVMFAYSATENKIYSDDLANLIISIKTLNGSSTTNAIDLDDASSISIANINADNVLAAMNVSIILHATISDNITSVDSITVPQTDINGTSIFDTNNYLKATEIANTIKAFQTLGVSDFANMSNAKSLDLSVFSTDDNMDKLFASVIVHKVVSDSFIDQNIVTWEYHTTTSASSVYDVAKNGFVVESELRAVMKGLNALGFTDPANASTIDKTQMLIIASDADKRNTVKSSAILSKVLSKVLIDNNYLQLVQMFNGTTYTVMTEYDAKTADGVTPVQTLCTNDVASLLANVALLSE